MITSHLETVRNKDKIAQFGGPKTMENIIICSSLTSFVFKILALIVIMFEKSLSHCI